MKKINGKILIIDSDLGNHYMMIEYLEANGFMILTAGDFKEAQAIIEDNQKDEHAVDIVLIEYDMNEKMTGTEFVRSNYDKNIEFIGMSKEPERKNEFFSSFASGFLTKPIDFLALTRTIITLMDVRDKLHKLILV